ncbi:hypothetical protein HDU67_001829 [Dinochytrium kinnereticum]|nr:hypothetical protein HDU67_001829 [Dinochytrium kinnereticum]
MYEVKLDFYKDISVEASRQSANARQLLFILQKNETGQPYWPRSLKASGKAPHFLKTDFSKWKDEDDDEDIDILDRFDASNNDSDDEEETQDKPEAVKVKESL